MRYLESKIFECVRKKGACNLHSRYSRVIHPVEWVNDSFISIVKMISWSSFWNLFIALIILSIATFLGWYLFLFPEVGSIVVLSLLLLPQIQYSSARPVHGEYSSSADVIPSRVINVHRSSLERSYPCKW